MSSATEVPEAVENDSGADEIILALTTPECRQDPYPVYARMRREHPVYRSTHGTWYLTRYADVDDAVHDLRLSNDRERMTRALAARQGALHRLSRLTQRLGRVVSNTDPPDHTRLRKLINKAFTARRVKIHIDAADKHTGFYYHTLGQYLRYFSGRPAIYVQAQGREASTQANAFTVLRRGLGLSDNVAEGESVRLALAGLDPLDAVVDYLSPHFIGLRTADGLYRFFGRNAWGWPVGLEVFD